MAKPASQEVPDRGQSTKLPLPAVWGNSGYGIILVFLFLPAFPHILPLTSITLCSPLTAIASGDFSPSTAHESRRTISQRIRESLSPWWVLMLGMRTGCRTRSKRERKQCLRSRNGDAPHAVVLLGYVKLLCTQGQ